MNGNRIIVHALIKVEGKYLVIKRSKEESTYPEYWDIPGGLVELGELPKDALLRETKEEVNLLIDPIIPIHEDSNLDKEKNTVFIRLVYLSELKEDIKNIKLDLNEHTEYKLIDNINELGNEKVAPFLIEVFNKIKKRTY